MTIFRTSLISWSIVIATNLLAVEQSLRILVITSIPRLYRTGKGQLNAREWNHASIAFDVLTTWNSLTTQNFVERKFGSEASLRGGVLGFKVLSGVYSSCQFLCHRSMFTRVGRNSCECLIARMDARTQRYLSCLVRICDALHTRALFQLKVDPVRNHRTHRLCHPRVIRPIICTHAFLAISAVSLLCRHLADLGLRREAA